MVNVVKKVLENAVRHALKVDDIDLSANPKVIGYKILDTSNWFATAEDCHAVKADVRKELAHLPRNVTVLLSNMIEEGQTLAVVFLEDLTKVGEDPFSVRRVRLGQAYLAIGYR